MTERKVDMVRVPRAEEYYSLEDVFGRDVSSVFPKQAKNEASTSGPDADAIREMLGARKFISETELESIKSTRGASADDGSVQVLKPLAEVLREAKERKDSEFQDKWKQMKQGKNRPLDDDELQFMNELLREEAEKEYQKRRQEEAELEEFRKALHQAREPSPGATGPPSAPPPKPKAEKPTSTFKPVIKPAIKVKPKSAASDSAPSMQGAALGKRKEDEAVSGPETKKTKVDEEDDTGGGLAGLLGGYGSSDDEGA